MNIPYCCDKPAIKELGYTDEMIAEDIKLHEEAEKESIKISMGSIPS